MRVSVVVLGLLVLCAQCLSLATPCVLAASEWELVSSSPKAGGYGQAVLGTNDLIYILRAYSTGAYQFWLFSPATGSWTDLTPPPVRPKNGTAMATDGGEYIYVLLGAAYSDTNRTFFYRYHIPTDQWESLNNTPFPQGAGNASTWSGFDQKFYALLGSSSHRPSPAFAAYDPATDSWEVLPFPPNWRAIDDGAALAWAGGEWVYALAGEWDERTPHYDFARYHIPTRTWERLPDIPDPGGVGDGGSLLWVPSLPGCLFVLGGGSTTEAPGNGFFMFDLATSSWTQLAPLPCPVGEWNGNRLAFAAGALWYWQGTPTTWPCGGNKLYKLVLP